MVQPVFVSKIFIESIKSALNVLLEQDSDYKQVLVLLVLKMKFNGIQFVSVKSTFTSLTDLVVSVQMEQLTIKTNNFVTIYVQKPIKSGMEKSVFVPKDLILLMELAANVKKERFTIKIHNYVTLSVN